MKILFLVLTFGFLTLSGALGNEPNNVTAYEASGHGNNKTDAIKNALAVAVGQARGVKVGSGSYEFDFVGAGMDVNTAQKNIKSVGVDAVAVQAKGTISTNETGGLVKTYQILEEKKLNDGSYDVKLKAWIYDLSSQYKSKRLKVAVMPIKTMAEIYYFAVLPVSSDNLAAMLSQKITTAMVGTNKFDILDRESMIDFAREKHFLLTYNSPLEEQAKLAESLGADNLLIGTISEAKILRTDEYLAASGQSTRTYRARFVFNYRLVASTTKQVLVSGVAERYFENSELKAFSSKGNPIDWDPAELRDGIISLVANDVTKAILDRIYPIRVASVEGKQVIIDKGGNNISEGDLMDIVAQGNEIFDHDTNESLGKVEEAVATIRITKVSQNISFGEVVDGDINKISKGLICRTKETYKAEVGLKPAITRTKDGGTRLPFDKR